MFEAKGISKAFTSRDGQGIDALSAITFSSSPGEVLAIVGPTGSGKTTLLRLLAGLELPDQGEVIISGAAPDPGSGKIGYLSQAHTLLPWKSVGENVGLPLLIKGQDKGTIHARVKETCAMLGLGDALGRYPYELSGGMQQRAALARLIVWGAQHWLLDEPFSHLDERTRHGLQELLLSLASQHSLNIAFVTHNIDEALYLGDRVIVLSAGPGRVAADIKVNLARPRQRLSADYGQHMERIRTSLESALAG